MTILVICVHVIVCLVLIVVILLQAGRSQGLTGATFGGNVQSLFGTKASSFLTKATSVCAILFLFTCIGLSIMEARKSRSLYQTPGAQVPLDVDQIKKALAKVKKDGTAAEGAATDAVKSSASTADKAVAAAQADGAAVKAEAEKK